MKMELGYGKKTIPVTIPDANLGRVLQAGDLEAAGSEEEIMHAALDAPVKSPYLEEVVKAGEKVVIITSDVTRPMPSARVLPVIVDRLNKAGVSDDDITVVFGLGSHRKHTEEEKQRLAGEDIFHRIRCIDSDGEDVVSLGMTTSGTPMDIFRPVVEADRRIALGNIEYHYFAGYSGGYKALMPGVSTFEAIQKNHSHMVKPAAKAGNMVGNPVREDMEETAKFITIDFLFNVVLDEHKKIVGAFAGHPVAAHRKGCDYLDTLYSCSIEERADIVVVSPGGFPKDINLYQAQKALDNSKHAVKKGGIIILTAACTEGLGGESFEKWMIDFERPEDMVDEIQRNFILGGHKAAAIALVLENADIYLVSDMKPDFVRTIFMEPYTDAEAALDKALSLKGPNALVHVMPYGGSVLPHCAE
jgi:nickel-dependent lactate racemase